MKLYIPKGANMSETEKAEWIETVEKLTSAFHEKEIPIKCPMEIKKYQIMKKKSNYKKFITEMWQGHYDHAEKMCLENRNDFLKDDLLRYAFFLSAGGLWQKIQLPYLESKWDTQKLECLLKEDHFFHPYITDAKYFSSETMINHLTHLTLFQDKLKVDINKFKTIIEFGGGYGGMARLFRRICGNFCTHIIIDLPIFIIIQAYYLKNIFGDDQINLIINGSDNIKTGKINLIEISKYDKLRIVSNWMPDLFVATWSLSEANNYTQEYISSMGYFDSKYILNGYRHYEEQNIRIPCSDSMKIPSKYKIVHQGSAFYAFAQEQYYLFACKSELY